MCDRVKIIVADQPTTVAGASIANDKLMMSMRAECRTGHGDVRAPAEVRARDRNRMRLRHLPTNPTSVCVHMLFSPHVVAVGPSSLMIRQAKELVGPVATAPYFSANK